MLPNSVIKVGILVTKVTQNLGPKFGFQTSNGSSKFENRHYTPVDDLAKIGVWPTTEMVCICIIQGLKFVRVTVTFTRCKSYLNTPSSFD